MTVPVIVDSPREDPGTEGGDTTNCTRIWMSHIDEAPPQHQRHNTNQTWIGDLQRQENGFGNGKDKFSTRKDELGHKGLL